VPFEATRTHDATEAYLQLLDHVLADRVITDVEVRRLRETARAWGLSALEVECLHRGYLARVWEEARADDRITRAELHDIRLLGRLLGVPPRALAGGGTAGAAKRWISVPVEPGPSATVVPGRRAQASPGRPVPGDHGPEPTGAPTRAGHRRPGR
jgi:hypothetical protein